MKNVTSIILIFMLVLTVFSACDSNSKPEEAVNVKLGVIETTGYKDKSYIHFLIKI